MKRNKNQQPKTMQTSVNAERQDYIASLDQAELAGMVTKEYVLAQFVKCVEGIGVFEGIKPPQVIRALERLGDFKKMFIKEAKLDINILGQLVSNMPMKQLETIVDAEVVEERDSENLSLTDGSGSKPGLQPRTTRSGRSTA